MTHCSAPRPLALIAALLGLAGAAAAQAKQPVVTRAELGSEALVGSAVRSFTSSGVSLLSQVPASQMSSSSVNDCWGYVAPSGREYALVCTDNGTSFVEVTNPSAPNVLAFVDGPDSGWRDVKVFEDHAYAVSEGGSNIQVFDLSAIDSGVVAYLGSVGGVGGLPSTTHNVVINEASGFLYRSGMSGSSSTAVYDLNASKSNPPHVATIGGLYLHDAQAHTYTTGPFAGREVLIGCGGSSVGVRTWDVTDKNNVVQLDTVNWSLLGYSHQGWLDKNQQYFYVNDESDETSFGLDTRTIVVDASDPSNLSVVSTFDNNNPAIGHNGYVAGDLLYEANYTSGLRVFDLSVNATNPPEVAWFDSYDPDDSPVFTGMWSCFPYFPSGVVLGSDTNEGLLVFFVGDPLLTIDLAVTPPTVIAPAGQTLPVVLTESAPGNLQPGTETLHYNDGSGWTQAPLVNLGGGNYEAHFPALGCGASVSYYLSAESTNGLIWTSSATQSAPYLVLVANSQAIVFQDDFETDQGWVATNQGATSGDWDRGMPVDDPGWSYDPASDSDGSGQCWLTENAFGNSDVDDGSVRLRSPDLDLSGSNVVVQYDYYLNLTDADGSDMLRVEANDMVGGSGWLEVARHYTSGGLAWRTHQLVAADFAAAGVGLSTAVRIRFEANDADPQSIVESGLDAFSVTTLDCGPAVNYCTAGTTASGCAVTLVASGTPSLSLASGFDVDASNGEGAKQGLFFFGSNGRQANPWGNGTSYQCVVPPVKRTPVALGGGTTGNCDGGWALDFNAFVSANPKKAPPAGVPTQLQLWFRDPLSTSNQTTSLSDAVEFTMAP